jgi:hypothetical protein
MSVKIRIKATPHPSNARSVRSAKNLWEKKFRAKFVQEIFIKIKQQWKKEWKSRAKLVKQESTKIKLGSPNVKIMFVGVLLAEHQPRVQIAQHMTQIFVPAVPTQVRC